MAQHFLHVSNHPAVRWRRSRNYRLCRSYPSWRGARVVNVGPGDALNMRERPDSRADIVARKRHNECGIRVNRRCRRNWCPAEDGHALGWVHRRYLAMVSPAMYCIAGAAPGDTLNLRAYPSPRSRVLHQLRRRRCGIAFLPHTVGNWQRIRVDGWQGWVNRRYLSGQ